MKLVVDGVDLMPLGIGELKLELGPPTSTRDCASIPKLTIAYYARRFFANMKAVKVVAHVQCPRCGATLDADSFTPRAPFTVVK
jgi:hypothetical protein